MRVRPASGEGGQNARRPGASGGVRARGPGFPPDLQPHPPIFTRPKHSCVWTSVTPLATSSQMRGAAARGGAAGSTGGPCACGSTRWVLLRQPPGPALSVHNPDGCNPDGCNSPSSRRGATFSTSFLAAWRQDPTAPGPVGGCDRCHRACGTGTGEDRHRCRAHPAPTARSRWRPPSKQPLRDETNPSPAAPWSGAWRRSCAIASTCRRRHCGGPCAAAGRSGPPDWIHVSALLGGVRALPRGSVGIKLCRLIVLASCDAACLARMSNARRSPAPPAPPPPANPTAP